MSRLLLYLLLAFSAGCASLIDSEPQRLNNGTLGELAEIKGGGESVEGDMISDIFREREDMMMADDNGGEVNREMTDGGLGGEERRGLDAGSSGGYDNLAGSEQAGETSHCVSENELCNDLDDDCDGVSDEGFINLGMNCDIGFGQCQVEGILVCSGDGRSLRCMGSPNVPQTEQCDQKDNDCDGQVDEELSDCCIHGMSRVCGLDIGSCTLGTQSCENGEWSLCDGIRPSDEICDGADNDCDQIIDESLLNVCGECGLVPQESCNDLDDDCDGRIDERVTNACGECGSLPSEICDGQDNDCDGRVDERVTNACGECGSLANEVCDGQDNDCDGRIDEGLARGSCSVGVGQCLRSGQEVCINGQFVCNVVAGHPVTELCNGADDDCDHHIDEGDGGGSLCIEVCNGQDEDDDGDIDEGVTNACGQCGVVPTEVCNEVDDDCDGQIDEHVANACGGCALVPNEICDGRDNDCDGQIDENVLNTCGTCGAVPNESCDGIDNDCDGEIDEIFSNLGQDCLVGIGECIRNGQFVCSSLGVSVCNAVAGSATTESCDQKDNDCDGSVDEDFNLDTDVENCGQCNQFCIFNSDRCVEGSCVCGPAHRQCNRRQECMGNYCEELCERGDLLCP